LTSQGGCGISHLVALRDVFLDHPGSVPTASDPGHRAILRPAPLRQLLGFCLFEAAYYIAYRYGMSFSQATASPFWFPDSVLLCGLLLSRPGQWWLFIAGILPIRVFSEVARDLPLWFLLATFAIDSVRGVLTATALRRFLANPTRIDTIREFGIFCLWAVLLMPAASALAGAAARQALGHAFWPTWEQWFLGNALTHLVVTPAILCWVFGSHWKMATRSGARWAEAALVGVGLLVTGYLAFDTPSTPSGFSEPRFYAPVPLLFWAAIRFGMAGASGGIVLIAGLAVEAALEVRGPFAGRSPADTALALQHFLLLRTVPLYLIAILGEQRSAVEQSLRESQERTSLAATAAELGLWDWDIARDQVWYTRTGRIDLGALAPISFGGFIGLVHPDDRREVGVALSRAMSGSGDFESTYRIVLADGTTRWVVSIGRVEFDTSGRPAWLRGVSRDVTRSHEVEQQAQRQRDELAHLARIAALGELSGSLAHELRQPLTAIFVNARAAQRVLERSGAGLGEMRAILNDIVVDNQRAAEIIERLQLLFKKGEVRRQSIDVNDLVRRVLPLAQSELTRANVELETDLAAALPLVDGDQVQLQQVLVNLVANACHAMADVARPRQRLLVRTSSAADAGVRVTIADGGRGIPAEDLERIFEPFVTSRADGMGLGLAVCRTIIRAHGGTLWAENNPGGGASFHFVLPGREKT
jgi:signal transduction histidine kinase